MTSRWHQQFPCPGLCILEYIAASHAWNSVWMNYRLPVDSGKEEFFIMYQPVTPAGSPPNANGYDRMSSLLTVIQLNSVSEQMEPTEEL